MTAYLTIEAVELMSAGMVWKGGADYYVTAEHLADIVAAQADPLIRAPRVKLGHLDELFGALAGMHDPTPGSTDGMPGFGTVINLRLTEAGAKLVGDLSEVPDWLAEAMPSAYPTRSCEWVWDYETQGGRKYKAVLTDVALGSWRPAVEDLADVTREQATAALQALLTDGPDAALAAASPTTEEAPMGQSKETSASASVSQDRIVSAFEKWAWDEIDDGDHILGDPPPDLNDWYWAWCRDVRIDPNEIIACVEGETWSVPFTTDGAVTVTFAAPVEVRETFIPVTAGASAAAVVHSHRNQRVLASNLPRPDRPEKPAAEAAPSTPMTTAASRPDTSNERIPMDEIVRKFLAAAHGLDPDTATETEVNAAVLLAATAAQDTTDPEPEPETTVVETAPVAETPAVPEAVTPPVERVTPIVTPPVTPPAPVAETPVEEIDRTPELVAAAAASVTPPDTMTVSRAKWDETQATLARLVAQDDQNQAAATTARRDGKADRWVQSGRITPDEYALARANLDIDEKRTTETYDALAEGRTPVTPRETNAAASASTADDQLLELSRARMGHPTNQKAA
jgi:hypothetical protein